MAVLPAIKNVIVVMVIKLIKGNQMWFKYCFIVDIYVYHLLFHGHFSTFQLMDGMDTKHLTVNQEKARLSQKYQIWHLRIRLRIVKQNVE